MKDEEKKQHGGKRAGAGRPRGGSGRRKEQRQLALAPELWARIDAELVSTGMTRTAFFEKLAEAFFKQKYFSGT